ncbi:hypothetical protein GQ42DRAFT_148980 [Ramicandelaber brevisporus]|nr:hypothetical protein GQ42DRAFT_148980 [Ramicandelaber brevisporus]
MRFNIVSAAVTALVASLALSGSQWFDRVFIIIFENKSLKTTLKDDYFAGLAKQGLLLSNYKANFHPSQPNYVALTYGSNGDVKNDKNHDIDGKSIVDLLEAKGVSWKSYQEKYPGKCSKVDETDDKYARKHNPFISFKTVQKNKALCDKIVNAEKQLPIDLKNGAVPQYSFYTPDLDNDAHDTNVKFASKWLKGLLPKLMDDPVLSKDTAFVLTFDEDDEDGDNTVYTVILGKGVKPGSTDKTKYDHYSLLRTIEDNFELGNLGRNDAKAKPISSFV